MNDEKRTEAYRRIRSVTLLALGANLLLFGLKLIVGLLVGSVALVADGIHSLSDTATDIGVMLGVYLGSKKPDESHQYGHGRAETFAALFIALFLLVIGGGMIYYAAMAIADQRVIEPKFAVLIVAMLSVIIKETLFHITRSVAHKYHSAVLYANAWHQRSDAFSSVAVVFGFIALKFGYRYGDQLAAMAVGLMIMYVAVKIIVKCFGELEERAVDIETVRNIENTINENPQIRNWHKLRTRSVGREIFLDVHILVDAALNVIEAHNIAEKLEDTLNEKLSQPVNITVHVEPDIPQLRK